TWPNTGSRSPPRRTCSPPWRPNRVASSTRSGAIGSRRRRAPTITTVMTWSGRVRSARPV
ncbi:MAG: hypothetical protein AVDCRST_MAG70-710, partial [uncultured Thermomicrobiales bacterium]